MNKLEGGSKFVGVTLDAKSAALLYEMARVNMRTISGQVRWMIERENNRQIEVIHPKDEWVKAAE